MKAGSPPHARGRLEVGPTEEREPGITPACAGKTSNLASTLCSTADHPRMRGEDTDSFERTVQCLGSPPHARGRPSRLSTPTTAGRITPACAGKTPRSTKHLPKIADHPRMRGEDLCWRRSYERWNGSPPHARGRLRILQHNRLSRRITPACAGKTLRFRWTCGRRTGSPPHARGRHENTAKTRTPQRITPACAGKTSTALRMALLTGDHPRMRGEDAVVFAISDGNGRITPACAGKTVACPVSVGRAWDHPRMRGEDLAVKAGEGIDPGSPPHARGRLRRIGRFRLRGRITPACAGKTLHADRVSRQEGDHPRMRGEDV